MSASNQNLKIRSHRDLIAWQKAMDLVVNVYSLSKSFPPEELYALTKQVRRAVTSVPANIAEGQGRRLSQEFHQFLANARGSLMELDTHLEVAFRGRIHKKRTASRYSKGFERSRTNSQWSDAFDFGF